MAKAEVTSKIAEAFGDRYIGEQDKKLYVWANDGSERIQIAISLTCPKVYIGENVKAEPLNFEDEPAVNSTTSNFKPAEVTKQEEETLAELLERLGL